MEFSKLDERVKETVINQFVRHANHLKELILEGGYRIPEADKGNIANLAAAILEAQEQVHMETLSLRGISSKIDGEPLPEDMRLINAIVNSGITKLNWLDLSEITSWFSNSEAHLYLIDFIKQQTCLKKLNLRTNVFSSAATTQVFSILL